MFFVLLNMCLSNIVCSSLVEEIKNIITIIVFNSHLLCHVTCITSFNKCSDPDVKLANLRFFITLAR